MPNAEGFLKPYKSLGLLQCTLVDSDDRSLALQVSDSFPFKWINKKWKEGFYVTSMATSHTRWAVVMSRNAGFVDQCVELDFQYPSEGIHRRWDAGGTMPDLACACVHPATCTVFRCGTH